MSTTNSTKPDPNKGTITKSLYEQMFSTDNPSSRPLGSNSNLYPSEDSGKGLSQNFSVKIAVVIVAALLFFYLFPVLGFLIFVGGGAYVYVRRR